MPKFLISIFPFLIKKLYLRQIFKRLTRTKKSFRIGTP